MDASPSLTPRVKIIREICLADCATTHSILQQKKYFFSQLTLAPSNVTTISGPVNLIEGFGEPLLFYHVALFSTFKMPFIPPNPNAIYLVLKISVGMDTIKKQ